MDVLLMSTFSVIYVNIISMFDTLKRDIQTGGQSNQGWWLGKLLFATKDYIIENIPTIS